MCFGMQTTQQQTNTPSPFVQNAGQQAFGFAQNLASQPFAAPLQGVAGFTPLQTQGWGTIASLASAPNANNPFYNTVANDYASYGAAPAGQPTTSGTPTVGISALDGLASGGLGPKPTRGSSEPGLWHAVRAKVAAARSQGCFIVVSMRTGACRTLTPGRRCSRTEMRVCSRPWT